MFIDYLGAEDTAYTRAVTRKAFTAAVARAIRPGTKFDTMIILSGPQGIGKNTSIDIMGGAWFCDSIRSFESKELYELIQGNLLIEIAELQGFSKVDTNRIKQVIRGLSNDLMEKYQQALTGEAAPDAALEAAEDILLSGFGRLSNVLIRYEREIQVLKVLQHQAKRGYTHYLFLCEKGQNSCERCESGHGKLMEMNELFGRHLVPPLHPNCRCELMCMDYAAAMVYTKNPERFLQNLETVIERSEGVGRGGMYLLDADYASVLLGTTSAWKLERITDTHGGVLADLTKPFGYEAPFRLPNVPQDFMELLDLYRAAQEYRSAHKWDSFGTFLDWLTGGIPVGMWNSAVGRWDTMIENPSLLTVLNFLTLGTSGMVVGAIEPEEMLSLQHWLDMLGTALLVYGLYRNIKNAASAADDIAYGQSWYRSELTQEIIDKIVDLGRGNRPNPSTYLSKSYISTHLSYFKMVLRRLWLVLQQEP